MTRSHRRINSASLFFLCHDKISLSDTQATESSDDSLRLELREHQIVLLVSH